MVRYCGYEVGEISMADALRLRKVLMKTYKPGEFVEATDEMLRAVARATEKKWRR